MARLAAGVLVLAAATQAASVPTTSMGQFLGGKELFNGCDQHKECGACLAAGCGFSPVAVSPPGKKEKKHYILSPRPGETARPQLSPRRAAPQG